MLLLTGASGYIGKKLLPILLNNGAEVAVLTRKSSGFDPRVTVIQGDLLKLDSLKNAFQGVVKVIHLAAVTHARTKSEYYQANLEGTQNLIKALPKNISQFVYVSTNCAVPGAGWYGESKLAAEQVIKTQFQNYTILRVADVYGGNGEKSLEKLIDQVTAWPFFPLVDSGQQRMAPVHVDDVITAIAQSTSLTGQHELVVAGTQVLTFKQLVEKIADLAGSSAKTVSVPAFVLEMIMTILSRVGVGGFYPDQVKRLIAHKPLDSAQTWKLLSVTPHSFDEWLKQQVQQRHSA